MHMNLLLLDFLQIDHAYETQRRKRRMQLMRLREQYDLFNLSDNNFKLRYGLSKELARKLCDEIRPKMATSKKSNLSVDMKVLIALSFFKSGSVQHCSKRHLVSQRTVLMSITQVANCLNSPEIRYKYLRFPSTEQEHHTNRVQFYAKYNIAGVVGCIKSFKIPILRPKKNGRYYYSNNKYSLNVQLISDTNKKILDVNATNGGATSDSEIWKNNPIKNYLEELNITENNWILGNSTFTSSKTILTPILGPDLSIQEIHKNELHIQAMGAIKATIDELKTRFLCLNGKKILHYSPEVAGSIVTACCVIHNFCIQSM